VNVFIIEDSPTITLILERTLSSYGYIPLCHTSDTFSTKFLKDKPHEFFIMDTNLYKADSLEICSKIKEVCPSAYVIGINHRGTWKDRIEFLKSGADDCISYPFPPEEILVRIQALLRRPKKYISSNLKYGKFLIDTYNQEAFYNSRLLKLSKKEYQILEYFIRNKERKVSRSELLDHVWDYRKSSSSNTVDVHITKLRRKITKAKNKRYLNKDNFQQNSEIQTIYGVGYQLKDNFEEKGS